MAAIPNPDYGTNIFKYGYDGNNRLTSRWTPAKGTTTYALNKRKKTDPARRVTKSQIANLSMSIPDSAALS